MTLFNSSKAKVASFKKAKFFYIDSNIKGGIKFAEYEYPNTDRRDIETLGKMLKKITVNGLVDCNVSYKNREKLEEAFEDGEAGILSLPFYNKLYGNITEYSFSDSNNNVGQTTFSCEFVEVSQDSDIITNGKGILENIKSKILGKYEEKFDAAWKAVDNVKKKFDTAKEKFDSAVETTKNIAQTISQVSSAIAGAGDSLGDASTAINQIVNSVNQLVKSPATLFNNIKITFDNLGVAFNSAKDVFAVCKGLFDVDGKDRIQLGDSTVSQDIRANQNLINQAVRINALTLAYKIALDIDYATTQEINNVIADLEKGFKLIDLSFDKEITDLLYQLRYNAINELNQLTLAVPNIIEYNVISPTPLINILFNLYGNDNNKDTIIAINKFNDTSSIVGNINVLKYG